MDGRLKHALGDLLDAAIEDRRAAEPIFWLLWLCRLLDAEGPAGVPLGRLRARVEREWGTCRPVAGMDGPSDPAQVLPALEKLVGAQASPASADGPRLGFTPRLAGAREAIRDKVERYWRALVRLRDADRPAADDLEASLAWAAAFFDEGVFWEFHEILEHIWMPAAEPTKTLLQGLVQIAIGFHHFSERNPPGAVAQLRKGLDKVHQVKAAFPALRFSPFLDGCQACLAAFEAAPDGPAGFDPALIPPFDLVPGWGGAGLAPDLGEGGRLYNAGRYLESHEVFEQVWMAEVGANRYFYKGLVHVAMGFHYATAGDYERAVAKLALGLEFLRGYEPAYLGLDVERLATGAAACLAELESLGPARIGTFDRSHIPPLVPAGRH
jgi:predicted metal-dependent hydrolase